MQSALPGRRCIGAVKSCSCCKGKRGNEYDDGRPHQAVSAIGPSEPPRGTGDRVLKARRRWPRPAIRLLLRLPGSRAGLRTRSRAWSIPCAPTRSTLLRGAKSRFRRCPEPMIMTLAIPRFKGARSQNSRGHFQVHGGGVSPPMPMLPRSVLQAHSHSVAICGTSSRVSKMQRSSHSCRTVRLSRSTQAFGRGLPGWMQVRAMEFRTCPVGQPKRTVDRTAA